MALKELSLTKFAAAGSTIVDMLAYSGVEDPHFQRREIILMHAISHVLVDKTSFHPTEIAKVIGCYPGVVFAPIRKFEKVYGILEGYRVSSFENAGRQRTLFSPTDLGHSVFGVFTPEAAE